MKKVKKRKPIPARSLKLYETIFEIEKSHKSWESCGAYFKWVGDQITTYNKSNNTRFQESEILLYVKYKSEKQK